MKTLVFNHCVKCAIIRFSLTRVFPYKDGIVDFVLMGENTGQRKPVFWHILRSQ